MREAGFSTSERCYLRPRSFDLAARRGDQFLFLKILSNIDGLNERTALEIRRLARHLLASPILVGEKTRDQYLERGAVYFRYGIPTLSLFTLADCLLEGALPLVYAAHGGLYVRIDGERMRQIRLARGISLGALAKELGVSRRTISKYEVEDMDTSVDVALRLEEIFNEELIEPVDPFQTEAVGAEKIEVRGAIQCHNQGRKTGGPDRGGQVLSEHSQEGPADEQPLLRRPHQVGGDSGWGDQAGVRRGDRPHREEGA